MKKLFALVLALVMLFSCALADTVDLTYYSIDVDPSIDISETEATDGTYNLAVNCIDYEQMLIEYLVGTFEYELMANFPATEFSEASFEKAVRKMSEDTVKNVAQYGIRQTYKLLSVESADVNGTPAITAVCFRKNTDFEQEFYDIYRIQNYNGRIYLFVAQARSSESAQAFTDMMNSVIWHK